ncbi:MAG TPA: hypothetical protein GX506_01170 [Firmicutes bacterium]|nr:hypothetical protein [Bacillota bacterium]
MVDGRPHQPQQLNPEIDIAREIKAIEWLKTELLGSLASLYQAMARNNEELTAESLSNIVVGAYLLGRRLGVSFQALDAKVEGKVRANLEKEHELEKWYGDFTAFYQYIRERKR